MVFGGETLAEQARQLPPGTNTGKQGGGFFHRGSTVEIPLDSGKTAPAPSLRQSDSAWQDLEFIGSSKRDPRITRDELPSEAGVLNTVTPEPVQTPFEPEAEISFVVETAAAPTPEAVMQASDRELRADIELRVDVEPGVKVRVEVEDEKALLAQKSPLPYREPPVVAKPHPLDSSGFSVTASRSVVDMDVPAPSSPPPALATDSPEFDVDCIDDSDYQLPGGDARDDRDAPEFVEPEESPPAPRPFNSSLITSEPLDE